MKLGLFSKLIRTKYKKLDIFKPCNVYIDNDAKIEIDGYFNFNLPHQKNKNTISGEISMYKNSLLKVKGVFSMHLGCSLTIMEGAKLTLGSGYMNSNSQIRCREQITIGDGTIISENVHIRDSDVHTIIGQNSPTKSIHIGKNVWIGEGATILKGVTIGNGAIIGAKAVVVKDIPAKCLAVGNPAKVIRENVAWK